LGTFVLLRNPKQHTGIAFFFVCLFISFWAASNYITGSTAFSLTYNSIFNRIAFVSAFLAVASCVWFSFVFPVTVRLSKYIRIGAESLVGIASLISGTSLVSGTVTKSAGKLKFSLGSLSIVYIAVILFFLGLVVKNLLRVALRFRGREKQQALYMLCAFGVPIALGLTTNAILPLVTSSWQVANLGPMFTVLFVGATAYAMIRHQLFDLRLAVARSLAYILSIIAIVTSYTLGAFALLNSGFGLNVGVGQGVTLALFGALVTLFFQPVKNLFDKVTNRIFYRDAYDPQEFFNEFNKALVSTLDLDKLLRTVTQIIENSLKAQYCLISIEDGHGGNRIIGSQERPFSQEEDLQLRRMTSYTHDGVIIADNVPLENERLIKFLSRNDIAALAHIANPARGAREGLGYIILGRKRSGNPYISSDARVLEAAANELVIAIQNALRFEEIQNFTTTLQEKVQTATKELRRTNVKLKLLDETKDEFITMASHQLRTPLTSVKGYLSMVLEGDAGKLNSNQEKLLEQSYLSSQRMVYLISDLLNLSRLNTGKFVIEPSEVDLSEVAQVEVDQLEETAKARGLTLVYDRPAAFPMLMLDETKIHQVVMNFIDNAIYYTPSGGTVTVALRETPAAVEYTVTDTGIGVPKAVQHKLFTKFYRAGNAQQARPDGTGLGLFMAKKVVAAQGGAIIFQSEEGKGSTFGFRFNKADHAIPGAAGKINQPKRVQKQATH